MRIVFFALLAGAYAKSQAKTTRDECNPCNPNGATGSTPPSVGTGLKSLYLDVLASVKDISFEKRWADIVQAREDGFCCRETLDCVNVQNLNVPMCYDKFTTNFAFSDGSYGSLTTGEYTQGGTRAKANLFSGQYSSQGSEGNIYADDPSAKPNTAILSIPPQWTGTGVGSAIPVTEIGGSVAPATTVTAAASSGHTTATSAGSASQTTGSSSSESAQGSKTAPSPSSSSGAAVQNISKSSSSLVVSLFTVLMYAIYAP